VTNVRVKRKEISHLSISGLHVVEPTGEAVGRRFGLLIVKGPTLSRRFRRFIGITDWEIRWGQHLEGVLRETSVATGPSFAMGHA